MGTPRSVPELTPQEAKRFLAHVNTAGIDRLCIPNACTPWTLSGTAQGYGRFTIRRNKVRAEHKAHRVAYRLATGKDPGELRVCHTCDNPPCCNPKHLFLGTQADNVADCVAKGRKLGPSSENSSKRKLIAEQVLDIRAQYAKGGSSLSSLAAKFGVTKKAIHFIVTRQHWRNI